MVDLSEVVQKTNTSCGEGTMFRGSGLARDPARIPFGIFSVDFASGGGAPVWGTTGLWGPECIAGDSEVKITTSTEGNDHSRKPTTIKRLFERFHNICGGKGKYPRKESLNATYYVISVDHSLRVIRNEILNVVHSGMKTCYRITTNRGKSLMASATHRFLTVNGYVELQNLLEGDEIFVHDNVRVKGRKGGYRRPEVLVKQHPTWRKKVVGDKHIYYRERVSRAAYEAAQNGYTYSDFIKMLNDPDLKHVCDDLWTIPDGLDIHHKDNDPTNNDLDNLELIKDVEHGRIHANRNSEKLSFVAVLDEIVEIIPVGEIDTYDLTCEYPSNNYIANGIVVHNSGGKSGMAANLVASSQHMCWSCYNLIDHCTCSHSPLLLDAVWADAEGTLDREWVYAIGADPNRYHVILADYGEMYANIADNALKADDCGIVIVDSLAALTPEAEMDAAAEDDFYAIQARMIGRMVRKLKQRLIQERKRGHPCALLLVNQMRSKIGVVYGSPETMSGGHALKHEFSLLLRCVKKAMSDTNKKKYIDNKKEHAVQHAFAIKKEKILTLAGQGEFIRIKDNSMDGLTTGQINDMGTVLNYAKEYGIVTKTGNSKKPWKFMNIKARKLDQIRDLWAADPWKYYYQTQSIIIERAKARLAGES